MKFHFLLFLLHFALSTTLLSQTKGDTIRTINHIVDQHLPTLYAIASHYNIRVAFLKEFNNSKDDIISYGDTIKIPASGLICHYVSAEDKNLWRISQKYKIELDDLLSFNHKKNDLIIEGEQLVFPSMWSKADYYVHYYTYKKQAYRINIRSCPTEYSSHYIRIQWYHKKNGQWSLVNEMPTFVVDALGFPFSRASISIEDFDENGRLDIIIHINQGARSYYSSYEMFTFDYKVNKIKMIQGFSHRNCPNFDSKTKTISSILGGPGAPINPTRYRINYKTYSLEKVN